LGRSIGSIHSFIDALGVAVLGVLPDDNGAGLESPRFVPRLILPLSSAYDHRVIDGAAAARFCPHYAGVLADVQTALVDRIAIDPLRGANVLTFSIGENHASSERSRQVRAPQSQIWRPTGISI
jgi:hypothetical protein